MSKPDTTHGHIFERELNKAFSQMYKLFPVRWGRVLDSAAAGNIVRKAEADYKLMVWSGIQAQPFMFHIEAKATVTDDLFENTFRSRVKGHQNAAMVMSMRAGAQGMYFYKRCNQNDFQIWNAALVGRWYPQRRKAIQGIAAMAVSMRNLEEFAVQLCSDPRPLLEKLRRTL